MPHENFTPTLTELEPHTLNEEEKAAGSYNPFLHDGYHCGQDFGFGAPWMVMYSGRKNMSYIILIDTRNGRRFKITLEE